MLRTPILLLTIGQLIVSSLFCAAITVEWHIIILPFLIGCVRLFIDDVVIYALQLICIMGSLGSGMVLLVSTDRALQRFYPIIATGSAVFVVLFVWFLVVSSMCFVMYRDKRRLR